MAKIEQSVYSAIQRENRRKSTSAVVTVFVVIPIAVVAVGGILLLLDHAGVFW